MDYDKNQVQIVQNPRDWLSAMPIDLVSIVPTETLMRKVHPEFAHIKWGGLRVVFANGRVFSIQCEHMVHYCTHNDTLDWTQIEHWINVATSVEIATRVGDDGKLQEMPGGDTVLGYVTPDQLQRFIRELLDADIRAGFAVASPRSALGTDWE